MGINRHRVSDRLGWDLRNIVCGPVVGRWVAEQTNGSFSNETSTALGLQKETGEIIAGVIYENWNKRSLVAHMAVTGRLTRAFIGAVFRYAYEQCGVNKVILPVSSGNDKSNRFVKHLGFREEARIKDADPLGDIIIYSLAKSDCRFLGATYG